MPTPPVIKRTNTILYCDRWHETVAFYRDRLGLEIAFACAWMVEFRLSPGAYLSVADPSRTSMASAGGKGLTLSFQTDDLETFHGQLAEAGLAPTPIRFQVMGGDVFFIRDPQGNRIEFWRPSGSLRAC